jgi:hypothetical protein
MTKNQTIVLVFVPRGFHALKLRMEKEFYNRTNGESQRSSNPYTIFAKPVAHDGKQSARSLHKVDTSVALSANDV